MNLKIKILKYPLLLFFFLTVLGGFSQNNSNNTVVSPSMNPWYKKDIENKRPNAYPNIREADVMWAKRIWRTIDLREKINQPLYYPIEPVNDRKSLFDVLTASIAKGEITAYGNPIFDDEFKTPLTQDEVQSLLVRMDTAFQENIESGLTEAVAIRNEISSEDIKQYWIKEDWFFDRQRSIMDVRIIGICPLKENKGDDGEVRGYQPLFWIYFPELRPVLATTEVYIGKNTGQQMSFDGLFAKRYFNSFIHKESNVYDRSVAEYKSGLDGLLESDKIKENIFNLEQDLWQY